jgi:hypothetical protein
VSKNQSAPEKKTNNPRKKIEPLQLLAALAGLGSLLGEKVLVDVGENTTLGNGDVTQELVQLLIVADGKLEVTGNDTGLLVVAGGVSSQLENLSSEVLEDGSEVNGSTGTDTLSVVALAEQTVNTANGEGQTSLGGTGLRVLATASLAAGLSASHFDRFWMEGRGKKGGV